jgi:hypothetical protein
MFWGWTLGRFIYAVSKQDLKIHRVSQLIVVTLVIRSISRKMAPKLIINQLSFFETAQVRTHDVIRRSSSMEIYDPCEYRRAKMKCDCNLHPTSLAKHFEFLCRCIVVPSGYLT